MDIPDDDEEAKTETKTHVYMPCFDLSATVRDVVDLKGVRLGPESVIEQASQFVSIKIAKGRY